MSFSQPTKVENPALHFYEWRNGQLSRYDKETKENIAIKLPFTFVVLDELTTVTGFHEPSNSGIFSNEIKHMDRQTLRVRAFKGGDIATGLYAKIKDTIKANGGRYTRSVYIAEKVGSGYVISHIKFTGAAFSAWLDFTREHNVEQGIVRLTGSVEGKKGATVYQIPTFEYEKLDPETHAKTIEACTKLDTDLQAYLTRYMDTSQLEQEESVHVDEIDFSDTKATPEQVAEFESRKAKKFETKPDPEEEVDQAAYNRAAVAEVFNDEPPFTDDDLPPEFR
jgi:hypothetical protein